MREDARRLLPLAGAWAALFLYADPRGPFALNDDFQYAETARGLLAGDGLRLPQWALSSTVAHAAAGAAATAPWGASNQALRLWMLLVGLAGAALVYVLARRWRAEPPAALLAACAVASSPLYAVMSASFHLDVTAAALSTAGLLAFLRGRETGSAGWLACASVLTAAWGLTRQTGFLAVVGGAAALGWERRLTPRRAAALLLPAGAAGAAFAAWYFLVHGPTWAWNSGAYAPTTGWWARPSEWAALLQRGAAAVQLAALLLAPLAAARTADAARRRLSFREAAALAAVALLAAVAWLSGPFPQLPNTLSRSGLGVVVLQGAASKPAGIWGQPWLWALAAAAAAVSSLILTRTAWAGWTRGRTAALLWVGLPYAASLPLPVHYDRYLIGLLPAAAAAFAAAGALSRRGLAAGFAVAALAAAATGAGLRDYFAWNRARWQAGEDAVAHGVPPERVENGFDWDGQHSLTRNLALLRAAKPDRDIGAWDWMTLNSIVAATSFSTEPPVAGWRLVRIYPYRSPLAPGGGAVRLYAAPELYRR